MPSAANPYRDQRTQYDPGMGMDELCDALNLGLYIGVTSPSGSAPTISSAIISFLQSGTGAQAGTVQGQLRKFKFLSDYDTTANYRTARDALTDTAGFGVLQVVTSLAVGVSGSSEAVSGYEVAVHGTNPRIIVKPSASSGSAGLSLFHTGSQEFLLKTDTGNGSILRLGVGSGNGTITTNRMVWDGLATVIYRGSFIQWYTDGTSSQETVIRTQSDPTGKKLSYEFFRTVDDITNPANYERLQIGSDLVTTNEMVLINSKGGTGTLRPFVFYEDSNAVYTERIRISGGIISINAPSTVNASAGEVVLKNNLRLRGANAANSGSYSLIGMNAADQVELGLTGVDCKFMPALVALGGGAAPTLGTIGGSGPATAAQNTWMRWIDSNGSAFWIPAWK